MRTEKNLRVYSLAYSCSPKALLESGIESANVILVGYTIHEIMKPMAMAGQRQEQI